MTDFSVNIPPPVDCKSALFRVKKFEYNSYKIEHPKVKGFLRIGNIPVNILKIPDAVFEHVSPNINVTDNMKYLISYQTMVGFTNFGKKNILERWLPEFAKNNKKQDLFSYIVDEQTSEPWNEYVIQGTTPLILRTKTTLTSAHLYPDYSNQEGDPIIHVLHNTSISISEGSSPESRMR